MPLKAKHNMSVEKARLIKQFRELRSQLAKKHDEQRKVMSDEELLSGQLYNVNKELREENERLKENLEVKNH